MNILNDLTPIERRFLAHALQVAETKQEPDNAKRAPKQQKQQGQNEEDLLVEQQVALPPVKKKKTRLRPLDAVDRYSQQIREENALWDQVERSLEYPFVYRSDKNKELCLDMLKRIPQFSSLSESDLMVVATHMEIVQMHAKNVLAGRPLIPSSPPKTFHGRLVESTLCAPSIESEPLSSFAESLTADVTQKKKKKIVNVSNNNSSDVKQHVYVLLRGKVALRMPLVQTSVESFVEPYELFALPITVDALPEGAWYETAADCMLLRLARDGDFTLKRVISRMERKVLDERIHFLQRQLRVKVFTHWTPQDYEAVARLIVPIRASWREIVVHQGEESDAMYFIKEGQCVVVRSVPLLQQQQQQHEQQEQERDREQIALAAHNSGLPLGWRSTAGSGGGKPLDEHTSKAFAAEPEQLPRVVVPSPQTRLVELVTLREGEFFGELGLLNHDVDWKPVVEKIFSENYWEGLLLSALHAPVAYPGEENMSFCSTPPLRIDDCSLETRISSAKPADGAFPPVSLPRQATVYTRCPCILYMLTHEHCRTLFRERDFAQLKEFSKGYPSCEAIDEQYERQRKWAQYRKELVSDVLLESTSVARQRSNLPPLRFH